MKPIFYISSLYNSENEHNNLYKITYHYGHQLKVSVDMLIYNRLKFLRKYKQIIILDKLEYLFINEQKDINFLYELGMMVITPKYYSTFCVIPTIL